MILEMHCHTMEHSDCSYVGAVDLVRRNFADGLQGTVLTDHNYLWPPEEILDLKKKAGIPDYYLILSGQEVSTPEIGHVLVYGADRTIDVDMPLAELRREFPQAALVWAHPFRGENIPEEKEILLDSLDAVEIFTSNHTVRESHRALIYWHRYKFTAISGTDVHALSYAGIYPTVFDHPVTSISELAIEIKAGRCRPYFIEIPRSGTSRTKVIKLAIGMGSEKKEREKIMVKTPENVEAWHNAARAQFIMEKIAEKGFQGGKFRLPTPLGRDELNLSIFERDIQGKPLFDVIVEASRETVSEYLKLTAQWLARLHNLKLCLVPPEEFLQNEQSRLERYLSPFYRTNHKHTRRAQEIKDLVLATEKKLYGKERQKNFIQGHGDFHPKNIYVGDNINDDPQNCFIAAIDFDSSYCMPRAFDVGTFLVQFRNQFYGFEEVWEKTDPDIFLKEYIQEANDLEDDFHSQVELFKARSTLSICYLLINVGLKDSDNLWRVLVEAEKSLASIASKSAAFPLQPV